MDRWKVPIPLLVLAGLIGCFAAPWGYVAGRFACAADGGEAVVDTREADGFLVSQTISVGLCHGIGGKTTDCRSAVDAF